MAQTTTTTSKQFTLNSRDIVKGLIIAVILPVLTIIYQTIEAGSLTFDWKAIGITAIGGFVSYIIKNFLSPAEIVVTNPDPKTVEAIKDGEATVKVVPK